MKGKLIRFFLFLLIIFFSVIIALSIWHILLWKFDNNKTHDIINKVQDTVNVKEIDSSEGINVNNDNNMTSDNLYWKYVNMKLIDVDFNKLKSINGDVVGWIKLDGTNINYPFVKTSNNSYYLNHSLDKSYNSAGWVFLDYRNNLNSLNGNTVIYAHGRLDKTMFGSLRDVLNKKWLNNDDNHVVRLSTEYSSSLWQVFSVYHISTTSDYIKVDFSSSDEHQEFINLILNRSLYNFNTSVSVNDKILTLSTCYNDNEKMVLHAKLIKIKKRSLV